MTLCCQISSAVLGDSGSFPRSSLSEPCFFSDCAFMAASRALYLAWAGGTGRGGHGVRGAWQGHGPQTQGDTAAVPTAALTAPPPTPTPSRDSPHQENHQKP